MAWGATVPLLLIHRRTSPSWDSRKALGKCLCTVSSHGEGPCLALCGRRSTRKAVPRFGRPSKSRCPGDEFLPEKRWWRTSPILWNWLQTSSRHCGSDSFRMEIKKKGWIVEDHFTDYHQLRGLTHLPWLPHKYVSEIRQHWFIGSNNG